MIPMALSIQRRTSFHQEKSFIELYLAPFLPYPGFKHNESSNSISREMEDKLSVGQKDYVKHRRNVSKTVVYLSGAKCPKVSIIGTRCCPPSNSPRSINTHPLQSSMQQQRSFSLGLRGHPVPAVMQSWSNRQHALHAL